MLPDSPKEIKLQLQDNINWIKDAMKNNLVVGSQAKEFYTLIAAEELILLKHLIRLLKPIEIKLF